MPNFTFVPEEFTAGSNGVQRVVRRRRTAAPTELEVPTPVSEESTGIPLNEEQQNNENAHSEEETTGTQQSSSNNRTIWSAVATELLVDVMYETYSFIIASNNNNTKHRIWVRSFTLFQEYLVQHRGSSDNNLVQFANDLTIEAFENKWGALKTQYQSVVNDMSVTGSGGAPGYERMAHFDKIGAALKDDATVHPKFTLGTSLGEDGTTVCTIFRRTAFPFDESLVGETEPDLLRRISEEVLGPVLRDDEMEGRSRSSTASRPRQRRRRNNGTARARTPSPDASSEDPDAPRTGNRSVEDILRVMRETNSISRDISTELRLYREFLVEKKTSDERMNAERVAIMEREATVSEALLRIFQNRNTNESHQSSNEQP